MKCDIIIPVYKAPDWVNLCVYALIKNTDPKNIGKIFLVNDCNDPFTIDLLDNLKTKYGDKIVIKQNSQNLGFVKTVNKGLELSTAKYVLLLNTDCLISKNTIGKLINHLRQDPSIGLICPISSNAANISFPIPEGWNYTQVDALLEKKFSGKNFDACTVVGNCLMITRKCLEKVGFLDEAYGTGYGEETDYQFKSMQKGFKAKVAIDTYVFHKAEASFGTSKEKQAKLKKNSDLFFSRWGEAYAKEMEKYKKHDHIAYITSHLTSKDLSPKSDTLFYLNGIIQNAGGVHVVIDIVNYLTINGESINIVYEFKQPSHNEIMLFNPLHVDHIDKAKANQIISTFWKTAIPVRKITDKKHITMSSFIQGYEAYFENGATYGGVETSYKVADHLITVSSFLQSELKKVFNKNSVLLRNGINYQLLHKNHKTNHKEPVITMIQRGNVMKGDWLLVDLVKRLNNFKQPLTINLVTAGEIMLPKITNKHITLHHIQGPTDRIIIYQVLRDSDIYLDTSLSEGFGLTALESMATGCIPIVSNSGGINEYLKDKENGLIIESTNNAESYIEAISELINNQALKDKLSSNAQKTAKKYDYTDIIPNYIRTLNDIPLYPSQREIVETNEETEFESIQSKQEHYNKKVKTMNALKKFLPKKIKAKSVSVIDKLYNYIHR